MKTKKITMYELIGLIKDNKAPKKIKVDNEIYIFHKGIETRYELEDDEDISLNFNYYIENDLLNKKDIEILEENDEWKDIKEIDELQEILSSNKVEVLIENVGEIQVALNKLIKNQKYLKERLDEK